MESAAGRTGSFLNVLKTIGAGFLGVRRREEHDRQMAAIPAWQVIIAGMLGAAIFVATLIVVVRVVVGGAGGQ